MGKNKTGNSGGGFLSFVNSIITDKVKLEKPTNKSSAQSAPAVPVQDEGDLALLQAINGGVKKERTTKTEEDAVGNRGPMGLGYQATKAELEATTQMQRLKNQIRKT